MQFTHWLRWITLALILIALTQLVNRGAAAVIPEKIVVNQQVLFGLIDQPVAVALVIALGFALVWQTIRRRWHIPLVQWGTLLIVAGAISNGLDRLFLHGVIDYLAFGPWSVFNLADSEIVVGVVLLLVAEQTEKRTQRGASSVPQ